MRHALNKDVRTVLPPASRPRWHAAADEARRAARFRHFFAAAILTIASFFAPTTIAGASDAVATAATPTKATGHHGLAMHGQPALAETFEHLPYVNPSAPKGGRISIGVQGAFDSLNPFIVKGVAVNNVRGYVYESLMARSADEPFSLYGLIAERVVVSDDRRVATFHLRRSARFSDGQPITADDVVFSQDLLKTVGRPYMRSHYGKINRAIAIDAHTVRFEFSDESDREIPLIVALMPILPKHAVDRTTFSETTLDPESLIGSGPYKIGRVDAGKLVVFSRDPNYWARDLPIRRGLFNFDEVRFEFYRDATSMFEAFKTGTLDFRYETQPIQWAEGYGFAAATDGRVKREAIDLRVPAGMRALVFNTRRPVFANIQVRRALNELFDFAWINQSLFNGLYSRSQSFFARSDLAAVSRPMTALEAELLGPHLAAVSDPLQKGTWRLSESNGSGRDRAALRRALAMFREAGFEIQGKRLVNKETGAPLTFEFLARRKSEERMMLAFAARLKQIGIAVTIRQVDAQQYWARLRTFDFDMIQWRWPASLSPGNEQINRWSSRYADTEGSLNFAGVKNPAADAMIAAMLSARDRETFEAAVRAFDRVLLSGTYVIPLFHAPQRWIAHWSHLKSPEKPLLFGLELDTWWSAAPRS
ncbi:MAG: extracellular solute-binding protein [Pseudomonadota bacterium]